MFEARKMRVALTHTGSIENLKRIERRLEHGDEHIIYQVTLSSFRVFASYFAVYSADISSILSVVSQSNWPVP